jgi:hypothetical protein
MNASFAVYLLADLIAEAICSNTTDQSMKGTYPNVQNAVKSQIDQAKYLKTYDLNLRKLLRDLYSWQSLSAEERSMLKKHSILISQIVAHIYDFAKVVLQGEKSKDVNYDCKNLIVNEITIVLKAFKNSLISIPFSVFKENVNTILEYKHQKKLENFDKWGIIEPTARPQQGFRFR